MTAFAETIIPSGPDIVEAHQRILPYIHRTPVLTSSQINHEFQSEIYFKCENFQKVGAFKARGATNAVLSLSEDEIKNGVATHSSGNHAQALSYAARIVGTKAYIVMPVNSSKVKIEAVKGYGGEITFCEPTLEARETTLNHILDQTGATEIHPYNNTRIISGQATSARELLQEIPDTHVIMAPVGGGGLLSGTALSSYYFGDKVEVIAAEPAQADDAFRSFYSKTFIPALNTNTIADGLRTSLGSITFPIILQYVNSIVTVRETTIIKAMRYLWERLKIIVEPSSVVPFAAIMERAVDVKGKKTGIILSGGNVDLDLLPWINSNV